MFKSYLHPVVAAAGDTSSFMFTAFAVQMKHRHYNQPYSEVDGMMVLQKYDVHNAGSCRVVLHPSCALATCLKTAHLSREVLT